MADSSYAYTPLGFTPTRWRRLHLLIPVFIATLVIVNVVVLSNVRPSTGPLDDYQDLNLLSPVHAENSGDWETRVNVIPPSHDERAVVTTLYTESYVTGVLTLKQSLQAVNVSARTILLYIPGRLSDNSLCRLGASGWELYPIERIPPPDSGRGVYHRFLDQYTKLHIWGLDKIGIKTVVYLDGDTIVRNNFDELWTMPFKFAAVPDIYGDKRGFTINFNAGVMVLRTSSTVLVDMLSKIGTARYHRKEAEQGFLNLYFGAQAVRLPYIYNANLAIKLRNEEMWQSIMRDVRIVHYTLIKPFIEESDGVAMDSTAYEKLTKDSLREKKSRNDRFWNAELSWWEENYDNITAHTGVCF